VIAKRLVSLTALALMCTSTVVVAKPPAKDGTADSMARDLYKEGDAAYAEGRYDDALNAFQEAYDLSKRPLLLYNIGNALERLGRLGESADALEKYLPHAKPGEKKVLEKRIANLRKRAEEKKPEPVPVEPVPTKPEPEANPTKPAVEPADKPHERPQPHPESDSGVETTSSPTLGWVLLGVGGAAIGTGAVFGSMALSARKDVDASCKDAGGQKLCTADAQSAIDRDKRYSLFADIGFGVGIAAAGVGTYLLLSAPSGAASKQKKTSLAADATFGRSGGMLRASWLF
jgi:tetratricopeptide (TPR) repeat protein